MALKTFNIDSEVYKQFSKHCKREGLSMSRKVENYIRAELSRIRCDVGGAIKSIERIELSAIAESKETKMPKADKKTTSKDGKEEHPLMKYC